MAIGSTGREFLATIAGRQRIVRVEPDGDRLQIEIDGEQFQVACAGISGGEACLLVNGAPRLVHVQGDGRDRYRVTLEGSEIDVEIADARAARLKPKSGPGSQDKRIEIRSPMHGTVVVVQVAEGNEVDEETSLIVLEAMKMQNSIPSPARALVRELLVEPGQTVEGETLLAVLERIDD